MVAANTPVRKFVPQQLDPSDFSKLEPLYRSLLDRQMDAARVQANNPAHI